MTQISTYQLKEGFQRLLRPCRDFLIERKISANAVTIFSVLTCLFYASLMAKGYVVLLVLMPFLLLFRMILNALDGMVAVETKTQSKLGMWLNEGGDIVSDLALFLGFLVFLPSLKIYLISLIMVSLSIEVLSLCILFKKGIRPLSGPFGKSDRAVFMGVLGLCLYFQASHLIVIILFIAAFVLSGITISNRLKAKS